MFTSLYFTGYEKKDQYTVIVNYEGNKLILYEKMDRLIEFEIEMKNESDNTQTNYSRGFKIVSQSLFMIGSSCLLAVDLDETIRQMKLVMVKVELEDEPEDFYYDHFDNYLYVLIPNKRKVVVLDAKVPFYN